uniref:Uncharacterized protein n=1 Tax=Rhizophora mucronata TaxID=61149 RepID=A0A2P2N865_RHIMU
MLMQVLIIVYGIARRSTISQSLVCRWKLQIQNLLPPREKDNDLFLTLFFGF